MHRHMGRGFVVLLTITTLALSIGCSKPPPKDNAAEVLGGGGSTDGTRPAYRTKFVQTDRCAFDTSAKKLNTDYKVDCGEVKLPENRADPRGREVTIPIAIIRSKNPDKAKDPLVYLDGGPGGSALADLSLWLDPPTPLLQDRDLILIDQRGTGYAEPRLWCSFELRTLSEDDPQAPAYQKCVERLKKNDVDVQNYGTGEAAADVADIRKALGVGDWNLLGISYGTRLALRVMHDHPEGVRSVILDSAFPPSVNGTQEFAHSRAQGIRTVLARCAATPACNGPFPNIESRMLQTIDRLNRDPIERRVLNEDKGTIEVERFNGEDFVGQLNNFLYNRETVRLIPLLIDAFARMDGSRLERALPEPPARDPDAPEPARSAPRLADGLNLAVQCSEEVPFTSKDQAVQAAADQPVALRDALVHKVTEQVIDSCQVWPHQSEQQPTTTSDIPTLVMIGSLDGVTPPDWGQQAASTLSKATVMTFDGYTHGVVPAGQCPMQKARDFLNDPSSGGGPPCPDEPFSFAT